MTCVEQIEREFMAELDAFERNYKHRKECPLYKKVGYCKHVETAERRQFAEKNTLLMQLRLFKD